MELQTRADGAQCADLVLLQELDREPGHLQPGAGGPGQRPTPRSASTAALSVRVPDANDHNPAFHAQAAVAEVELAEDAPVGSLLLNLDAADPDEGPNGDVVLGPSEARTGPRRAASSAWTRAPAASPWRGPWTTSARTLTNWACGRRTAAQALRRHLQGHPC